MDCINPYYDALKIIVSIFHVLGISGSLITGPFKGRTHSFVRLLYIHTKVNEELEEPL